MRPLSLTEIEADVGAGTGKDLLNFTAFRVTDNEIGAVPAIQTVGKGEMQGGGLSELRSLGGGGLEAGSTK